MRRSLRLIPDKKMPESHTLQFIISAQNQAEQTLKQVESQINGLQKRVKDMEPTFKKMALVGTAGFTAITGAVALSVKAYANAGDEVQKMAIRTGFGTVALSELKHAADLSGTSLEAVEKAIKKVGAFSLDVSREMSTAITTLNDLGLSVSDIQGLNPEETFFKLAEAVANIEDPLRRVGMAQEVFGKAGTELLPMLAEGADGIAKMRAEAHELGIIFDQEAANKAALFNDQMTRLSKSFDGVKYALAEAFIPILTELSTKIIPIIQQIKDWMKEHPELARLIVVVSAALFGLIAVIGLVGMALGPIIAGFGAFIAVLGFIASPIGLVIAAIGALIAIGLLLWKNWDYITSNMKAAWEILKDALIERGNQIKDFFKQLWDDIIGLFTSAYNKVMSIVDKIKSAVSSVKEGVKGAAGWVSEKVGGLLGAGQFGIENVPRTGTYLLHRGERVVPAGAMAGGGVVVNITGGYFLSEKAAEEIGNLIVKKIRQNTRIW